LTIAQTHGRITGYRSEPVEDAALIRNARLDCLATRALGAPVCVMHTVSNYVYGADATAALMHEKNDEFFLAVLPFAKEYGIRIATETYGICGYTKTCEFFGIIPEFIASYDRLAAHPTLGQYLTICMDTGHTHNATQFPGALSVGEAIRRMGKRISILHLHDNNGKADQHTIPLSGTADWKDILQALDEIGFDGYYNLEVSPTHFGPALAKDEEAFAIKILRNLLKNDK
jgi:sugar phosphate isomerase/epimerase